MNVIRYFVLRALQLPPEAWLRLGGFNGSIAHLQIRPSGRWAPPARGGRESIRCLPWPSCANACVLPFCAWRREALMVCARASLRCAARSVSLQCFGDFGHLTSEETTFGMAQGIEN
eukprot:2730309-Prymnesium_polylepis.1